MQTAPRSPFQLQATGWLAWLRRRVLALILTAVSVGAVVYLAVRSTQPSPPTAAEAGLLTLVATVANVLGAIAFARIGTVTPQHARSSVRRLLTVARTLTARYSRMNTLLASGSTPAVLTESAILTAEVGTVLFTLQDAINDWNEVHGEALAEVLRDIDA